MHDLYELVNLDPLQIQFELTGKHCVALVGSMEDVELNLIGKRIDELAAEMLPLREELKYLIMRRNELLMVEQPKEGDVTLDSETWECAIDLVRRMPEDQFEPEFVPNRGDERILWCRQRAHHRALDRLEHEHRIAQSRKFYGLEVQPALADAERQLEVAERQLAIVHAALSESSSSAPDENRMDECDPNALREILFEELSSGDEQPVVDVDQGSAPASSSSAALILSPDAIVAPVRVQRIGTGTDYWRGFKFTEIYNEQYSRVAIRGRAFSLRVPL